MLFIYCIVQLLCNLCANRFRYFYFRSCRMDQIIINVLAGGLAPQVQTAKKGARRKCGCSSKSFSIQWNYEIPVSTVTLQLQLAQCHVLSIVISITPCYDALLTGPTLVGSGCICCISQPPVDLGWRCRGQPWPWKGEGEGSVRFVITLLVFSVYIWRSDIVLLWQALTLGIL